MLSRFSCRSSFQLLKKFQNFQSRHFMTVINEYQKGIRMNLGQYSSTLLPGIHLNLPFYHQIIKVDIRERIKKIPKQLMRSRDNLPYYVEASIYYTIRNPYKTFQEAHIFENDLMERCKVEIESTMSSLIINNIIRYKEEIGGSVLMQVTDEIEKNLGIKITKIKIKTFVSEESETKIIAKTESENFNGVAGI